MLAGPREFPLKNLALIVGIDHYAQSPLSGCVNDANAMSDILSTHWNGLRNFSCRPLMSSSEVVTRASLKSGLAQLFALDADVALFYFSGHGLLK
ncbi:hypothetical protein ACVWZ3_003872 [Bradyrhizobium sp. i1.3.6]